MSRSLFPILLGVTGLAILTGLGIWQVQRLAWKNDMIQNAELRLSQPTIALPAAPDPDIHNYQKVSFSGKYTADPSLEVFHTVKYSGQGALIITAFETENNRRIMIDRGFLPDSRNTSAPQKTSQQLDGVLVWPNETGYFTPPPNKNKWYGRHVEKMAEALDTEPVLVQLLPEGKDLWPRPQAAVVHLPNNHLQYALTWFGLALVWAVMTLFWVWKIRQSKR